MQNAMYMCSFVAVLGLATTHFLTPAYDSSKLEEECYLELDYACLRPSAEQLKTFDRGGMSTSQSENEMMQIVVHSAHDYAIEASEESEGKSKLPPSNV